MNEINPAGSVPAALGIVVPSIHLCEVTGSFPSGGCQAIGPSPSPPTNSCGKSRCTCPCAVGTPSGYQAGIRLSRLKGALEDSELHCPNWYVSVGLRFIVSGCWKFLSDDFLQFSG